MSLKKFNFLQHVLFYDSGGFLSMIFCQDGEGSSIGFEEQRLLWYLYIRYTKEKAINDNGL